MFRSCQIILQYSQFNYEYCNITLARNKAPWWWSDKPETCRSVLKCFKKFFMWNYTWIHWLINWSDSAKNALCNNKIYEVWSLPSQRNYWHPPILFYQVIAFQMMVLEEILGFVLRELCFIYVNSTTGIAFKCGEM